MHPCCASGSSAVRCMSWNQPCEKLGMSRCRHAVRNPAGSARRRGTRCCRKDDDGTVVFNVPFDPAVPLPWANPFTAMGPVGACPLCKRRQLTSDMVW